MPIVETTIYDLFCDSAGCTSAITNYDHELSLAVDAREGGWKRSDDKWYCPTHAAQPEEGATNA